MADPEPPSLKEAATEVAAAEAAAETSRNPGDSGAPPALSAAADPTPSLKSGAEAADSAPPPAPSAGANDPTFPKAGTEDSIAAVPPAGPLPGVPVRIAVAWHRACSLLCSFQLWSCLGLQDLPDADWACLFNVLIISHGVPQQCMLRFPVMCMDRDVGPTAILQGWAQRVRTRWRWEIWTSPP